MSHRLQVLIPQELEISLKKASQRAGVSKGEFVRRAIEDALTRTGVDSDDNDPLERLEILGAPTSSIDDLVAETHSGML